MRMWRTVFLFLLLVAVLPAVLHAQTAAAQVDPQPKYTQDSLEQYWSCMERNDLKAITDLLWEHKNVQRIDASIFGLPADEFDDDSLLTIDERLWYRQVRADENNPLPEHGPIIYPHFLREALDHLYIVKGERPSCAKLIKDLGITEQNVRETIAGGWATDKDLTSGDSNARGEIHVAMDRGTAGRILVSTCPASAAETSNPTWHTTDYGATWTKTVNGNNSGSTWECDPFGYYQRSTGNVYQAKIGCNTGSCGSTYVMMRKSTNNGGTWADCGRPDTATNSDREQYAIDNTTTSTCYGKIYITWHNSNAEQVAVSGDSCATWTKTQLTTSGNSITPDVGVGADGHVYVAWGNFGTSYFKIAGSADCGATWTSPAATNIMAYKGAWHNAIPAQCVRYVSTEPLVDVDRCSWSTYYKRVYVIMADYEASGTDLGCSPTYSNTHNYELWLSYSDDSGATWHKPSTGATGADDITSFEGNTVDDFFPWLRVDEADGAVYVTWTRSRLAPASLTDRQITSDWVMRSLDGGKTWSTPVQVSSVEGSERTSGSSSFERGDYQAMDVAQGVLYPVWIDRRSPTAGSQTVEHPIVRMMCTEPAHKSERAPTWTVPATTCANGASTGQVAISWTAPDIYWGDNGYNSAARKFQLYVDGVLTQDNITVQTLSTTYTASNCTTSHTYQIKALNGCSIAKGYGVTTFTPSNCQSCTAPTGLTNNTAADVSACAQTGVKVTWTADATSWGDSGSGTRTYDVLRNGTGLAGSTGLAYGTTTYTDSTGTLNTSYAYTVRYNNGCGSSATTTGANAADANGTPGAPSITSITDVSACAASGIKVNYTAGSGATSHNLLKDGGVVVTAYTSGSTYVPGDTSSHTYIVQAVSGVCTTNSTGMAATDANGAPGAPVINSIADNDLCAQDGVKVNFTGGSGATSHNLLKDASVVVTGYTSGTLYNPGDTTSHTYVVRAVTASCTTDSTGVAKADANNTPGDGPTPSFTSVTCTTLRVNWTAITNATGVIVYRSSTSSCVPGSPIATVGGSATYYDDSGLTAGTPYYYYVIGTNGTCSSHNASCNGVTTAACTPPPEAAPGSSTSTAQAWTDKNTQGWPSVSGATSYTLYRGAKADLPQVLNSSTDSCTKYTGSSTSATISEDPTSVTGRFYWYIVTASNAYGEGPAGNATAGPRTVNSSGTCP